MGSGPLVLNHIAHPSQQHILPRVRLTALALARNVKRAGGAQGVGADEGGVADAGEEVGLAGFEGDEAAEDVEDVQEFGGVVGKPAVGLDFLKGRGRPPVADDGPGAVLLAVAEPVHQHLLARHFVLPNRWRHVVDEAFADEQAATQPGGRKSALQAALGAGLPARLTPRRCRAWPLPGCRYRRGWRRVS